MVMVEFASKLGGVGSGWLMGASNRRLITGSACRSFVASLLLQNMSQYGDWALPLH